MKNKSSILVLCLCSSVLTTNNLYALEKEEEQTEAFVPIEIISEPVVNEIELGIAYVSDDAYKFGRYNGMQSQGVYAIGDLKIRTFDENGYFWRVRGTDLGLESRHLLLEGGLQGSYKFILEYDALPNYKNNTVQTPFVGIGSGTLTLPAGFDINTNLDNNLTLFELETQRERIKVGAVIVPGQKWLFNVDFNHENKQGVDAIGAAIASGRSQVIGNTTTSLVPEPIDQDTDIVNTSLHYAGEKVQLDLKYHVSLYDNNIDSLTWSNPFPAPALATGIAPAAGSMSLAPDNEFHQLSLTGGYTLPYNSHLTGLISMGRMTQNQDFQPYTINTDLVASTLTNNALDGEVWLKTAQLKFSSRPVSRLRLNAELRYNERNNKTSVNDYDYVVLDSFYKSDVTGSTIQNRPYSYENSRINFNANYRFNAITSLRGGYKYNEMKRDYIGVERETTNEDTVFAKWKIKALSTVDFSLFAESSKRDGSEYNALTLENPAMRKYHLADRDRTKVAASIDYMATDRLLFSARADYNKDEYKNSETGLTEARQPIYTIDFSYQPRHSITTYGYYTYESIQSSQTSEDVSLPPSGTALTQLWQSDFDDKFHTVGLGMKWNDLGKWNIGADLVQSKSNGNITLFDITNPGTENQYPDTITKLNSAKLWASYNYSKQLSYKLGYQFENYHADNWAIDNVQAYDPTAVESTLLFGNQTLDYNVYVITASASYKY